MQLIDIKPGARINDYKAYASLYNSVLDFMDKVKEPLDSLQGRTLWMVNSTALGGGVAEMLPSQMRILRELGVQIEWLVIDAHEPAFFDITKRIHNAIHGSGDGKFTEEERLAYEGVNQENLPEALERIKDGDLVVIHDPQPLPLGPMIKAERRVGLIWRCHIGLDQETAVTRAVWEFLHPYMREYDHFVYSLPEYVPLELREKTTIVPPAIDPLSHKNRSLQLHKINGILYQAGAIEDSKKILYTPWEHQIRRVQGNGSFGEVNQPENMDLIFRPVVTEVSRWDRLKGFQELMEAFIYMKKDNWENGDPESLDYQRIDISLLVLAGPDPAFVSDDPEGKEVLEELIQLYKEIEPRLQRDIAILLLPLHSPKENALMVNALQRASSIVVQNSLKEGFGLTATEAMWKKKPVLVSGAAGLRFQVQDYRTGRINYDPKDTPALAYCLRDMLRNPKERDKWGFNGQIRVIQEFTLFSQLLKWLDVLARNTVDHQRKKKRVTQ